MWFTRLPRKSHGAARMRVGNKDLLAVMGGENTALQEQVDLWLLEHHGFRPASDTADSQTQCRRDEGMLLQSRWQRVATAEYDALECAEYTCMFYVLGRARFALAGTQSDTLVIGGGVADYGTHALSDVVMVKVSETEGTFQAAVHWTEVDNADEGSEFSGACVSSVGGCQAS